MNRFLEIASRISTPLALAGLLAAIFFFVARQIIAKNIFPALTKQISGDILKLIIDRFFFLSLIAMVLGFAGFVLTIALKERIVDVRNQNTDDHRVEREDKRPPRTPRITTTGNELGEFADAGDVSGGIVGKIYKQSFAIEQGTDSYDWSMKGDVPGLVFDLKAPMLSGTPTTPGSFPISIEAKDSKEVKTTRDFRISILDILAEMPKKPGKADVGGVLGGSVGKPYKQTFAGEGGKRPFTLFSSATVPGLLFDSASATLSGIPTTPGSFVIPIHAKDADGIAVSKDFRVSFIDIRMDPHQLGGELGDTFTQDFTVEGGREPYSWSSAGIVPSLDFDPETKRLSGTFTTPGSFPISIHAKDADGIAVSKELRISVLNIATKTQLPEGTQEKPYLETFAMEGGRKPYNWSLQSGTVPGLRFDGRGTNATLSGTPTTPGSFRILIQARDAEGVSVGKEFYVNVLPSLRKTDAGRVLVKVAVENPETTEAQDLFDRVKARCLSKPPFALAEADSASATLICTHCQSRTNYIILKLLRNPPQSDEDSLWSSGKLFNEHVGGPKERLDLETAADDVCRGLLSRATEISNKLVHGRNP